MLPELEGQDTIANNSQSEQIMQFLLGAIIISPYIIGFCQIYIGVPSFSLSLDFITQHGLLQGMYFICLYF